MGEEEEVGEFTTGSREVEAVGLVDLGVPRLGVVVVADVDEGVGDCGGVVGRPVPGESKG